MKSIVILTIFVSFAALSVQTFTEEDKENIRSIHKECAQESNVDNKILNKIREGIFRDNAKLKEHLLCFNKKIGVQNADGTWNYEKLEEVLSKREEPEKVNKKVQNQCKDRCSLSHPQGCDTLQETCDMALCINQHLGFTQFDDHDHDKDHYTGTLADSII